MTDIQSLNYDELVTYMAGLGEKKFRASQLYQWMHEKLADSFDECTNISNALRQKLKETSEYVCSAEALLMKQACPLLYYI